MTKCGIITINIYVFIVLKSHSSGIEEKTREGRGRAEKGRVEGREGKA